LSELELTLGEVAGAVRDAEQSVTYADRSSDWGQHMTKRTTHANALHQAGRRGEAEARFREAEQMQVERQSAYPLLYSVQGFQYCDLLLAQAERAAWQIPQPGAGSQQPALVSACRAVSERAAQTLELLEAARVDILSIALDHLTLGRAAFYAAMLQSPTADFRVARSELDAAVSGLRRAGTTHHIPRALLSRAWLRFVENDRDGAQSDLDEAWDIAERGPMRLFMADIHLYRARLFWREAEYPWKSPQADLAAARRLTEECGYGRRKEELEDAEAVILS
jgi:hypothetical protein